MKQSPSKWNETIDTFLRLELKKTRQKTEQCTYVRFNKDRSEYIFLAVFVDDLVIAGTTQEAIVKFKKQITAKYECNDLGSMEVTRTVEGGLLQSLYVKDVLEKFEENLPAKGSILTALRLPQKTRLQKKGVTHMRFK